MAKFLWSFSKKRQWQLQGKTASAKLADAIRQRIPSNGTPWFLGHFICFFRFSL
jgi:hypothetical protein